jgi:type II secretory pathway pseudopilin PulG
MKRATIIITISVFGIIAVAAVPVFYLWFATDQDEIASKHEWSIIQATEWKFRGQSIGEHLIFHTEDHYSLVGVLSADASQRVWILLNPRHCPFYKRIPEVSLSLTESDITKIKSSGNIHPAVLAELMTYCKELKSDSHEPP